jgi:U4/U6.U5 tri-snRNP component SNU23
VEDEALEAKKRKRLERDPLHQGLIVARANLKARDYQIDLAAKLNKSQVGVAEAGLINAAASCCQGSSAG